MNNQNPYSKNNQNVPTTTVGQQIDHSTTPFYRKYWWVIALIFVVIAIYNLGKTMMAPDYDSVASDIQSDIIEADSDFGDGSVSYNEDKEIFIVKIPSNATAVQNVVNGYPSQWNVLVRKLKQKSADLDDKGDNSEIEVPSPNDSSREYLEINKGKIVYNIADDD